MTKSNFLKVKPSYVLLFAISMLTPLIFVGDSISYGYYHTNSTSAFTDTNSTSAFTNENGTITSFPGISDSDRGHIPVI